MSQDNSLKSGGLSTLRDVATRARVSVSTVSRVINSQSSVGVELRERVNDAIKAVGYTRTRVSSTSPKASDLRIVTLVVPDLENPFFPLLIKGCESVARTHGYSLLIIDSENNPEIEESQIAVVASRGAKGIILITTSKGDNTAEVATRLGIPVVFLDRVIEGVNSSFVVCDNEDGAYQAVRYLTKMGHRRIAYVAGYQYLSTERRRFEGYSRALIEEGITADPNLVLRGEYNAERTYTEVDQLAKMKIDFTAIFASADVMAFGAKKALEDNRLRVPDDVSIVGFDDIPFASMISLTTVSQPKLEMGKNSMLLMLDTIEKRIASPRAVVLKPSIVIRGTCKKI